MLAPPERNTSPYLGSANLSPRRSRRLQGKRANRPTGATDEAPPWQDDKCQLRSGGPQRGATDRRLKGGRGRGGAVGGRRPADQPAAGRRDRAGAGGRVVQLGCVTAVRAMGPRPVATHPFREFVLKVAAR